MKSLNNYISGGFFNNIGAGEKAKEELLDEIIDWICKHDNITGNPLGGTYKRLLTIGDDGKIHYSDCSASSCIIISICISDKDTIPDNIYFGNDICLEVKFDGVGFDELSEWGKILPRHILKMEIYNMYVQNWKWISTVKNIDMFIVVNSTLPSNGFTGFNATINHGIRIQECNIKNLKEFPEIRKDAGVCIIDCVYLEDISGLAEKNKKFAYFAMTKCRKVKKIGDLSDIALDNYLYIDASAVKLAMKGKGKLFKSVRKSVSVHDILGSGIKPKEVESFFNSLYPQARVILNS